jgi:hypothetical protein
LLLGFQSFVDMSVDAVEEIFGLGIWADEVDLDLFHAPDPVPGHLLPPSAAGLVPCRLKFIPEELLVDSPPDVVDGQHAAARRTAPTEQNAPRVVMFVVIATAVVFAGQWAKEVLQVCAASMIAFINVVERPLIKTE